ncbi:restriction endonuclease subunit S [Pseudomonas sp. LjRoot71]|uniref:restriction endonuclease subunit S n=1 Tax=Pseudomonas sp. LjRoot71 TaxID=3342336 RepID=UPI003ED14533
MSSKVNRAVKFKELLAEPVRNGIYKQKEFHGRGCKIINMGELFSFPRLHDVPMKRVELTEKEQSKSLVQKGDLLFARRSLVAEGAGRCSIVSEVNEPTTFESSIIRARPNPELVSSDYLYYFFSSRLGRELMATILRQMAVSGITGSDLMELEIECPELEQQKSIAALLSSMDDRITLLRETNATLEAIAQALFKSWFVDFDPVRAKAEGRQPEGIAAPTAALFPDSFEESELGLVPKGWRVGSLGDIASIKGGKQLEKEFFKDRGVNPIFGGAGVMGHTDLKNAEGFVITVGRVGAYCGQFFWHIGEAWVNNNASHIQPILSPDAVWTYQWLRATNIDHIKKGAAQPFVSNGDLAELKLALPVGELAERFVEVIAPVYEQMASLQVQAQTLTQLRDTLLPRLISGQLRLPEAEQCVEEALV